MERRKLSPFEKELKEFKKNIKLKKQIEALKNVRGTKTLVRDLGILINRFIKTNPKYLEYKQLNAKYNRLRYGVNKVNPDYIRIKNYFSTRRIINNPYEAYTNLSPIKFDSQKYALKGIQGTIDELNTNIASLEKVFLDTGTKSNSKYNNIKILLNITFNSDNFWDILDSDQKAAIRKDEDQTGMVSDLRFTYTMENLTELIKGNPEFNYDKIKSKNTLTKLIKNEYFGSNFQQTLNSNLNFSMSDKTDSEMLDIFAMLLEE